MFFQIMTLLAFVISTPSFAQNISMDEALFHAVKAPAVPCTSFPTFGGSCEFKIAGMMICIKSERISRHTETRYECLFSQRNNQPNCYQELWDGLRQHSFQDDLQSWSIEKTNVGLVTRFKKDPQSPVQTFYDIAGSCQRTNMCLRVLDYANRKSYLIEEGQIFKSEFCEDIEVISD